LNGSIADVLWRPPLPGCVKANTDGSALESPTAAAIGVLFRDHHANYLRGSSQNIGYQNSKLFCRISSCFKSFRDR